MTLRVTIQFSGLDEAYIRHEAKVLGLEPNQFIREALHFYMLTQPRPSDQLAKYASANPDNYKEEPTKPHNPFA